MKITLKHAIGLALATAVISGASNFIAKKSVTVVSNPVVFTTLKNILVALLLVGLILVFARFKELRGLSKKQWYQLAAIGIVGGSVPFILFFTGLTLTSAVSASLIHKTLFIWVAFLAVPFLKERIGAIHLAAFMLLIGGNFALSGFQSFEFGRGELMILGATVLWAVENVIAKKALAQLSSIVVSGARMVLGSVVLIIVVAMQGKLSLVGGLSPEQWLWTLIPSALLLGYVLTWYTALKYAPASVVASLLVPASLITNFLSLMFDGRAFNAGEMIAGIAMVVAVLMIIIGARKSHEPIYITTADPAS
ncbi:MAG: hypothetical protein A2898_04730 [Candidatus Kerfeldbacteria bacterium RIFCSPLOWO2_01_FULL_48_11]|uniref:EamA domain-containing protein n=1 Tax=Candidatus Kerfeldbacteria bacterium RIFCSPLOWO2_01_FULL_48_11 TaxID=1798543 RepID=A0A1G2B0Z8_9BACT|nr:MAG: hypothetical protein UY34_C0001G0149 [Parcubacteria group bacterium GW2011_GWA2_48_9]KKW13696.1 MAG: hypothetical protein UY52_C0039G0004 [Parcubacteria group bacterium GW2011_GWC2_49_9]OGY82863.1 MAG: hypothetical protein A2898_04730 [Candidatus Kerfeldbacteria bacterium RIFCSPLOWO2_01_FULL_48_11]HCJ52741.1 hypothetical protein [Candidatus Kerfeldbacteria bacterium]HCM67872.1 hypothetical protein [Candidatus Kerfeldbacteria bacterium]